MKIWRGIANDVTAISDGAQYVRNLSFSIEGELRRRPTLDKVLSVSGKLGMITYGAPNGTQYIVLITSTGVLQVNSL